jgi:hypothetical protein
LEKGASLFHIPFNGMELGFLDGRGARIGWGGGRCWKHGRNYKKVEQKKKANEKRPWKKNPLPPLPSGLERSSLRLDQFFKL